MSPTYLQTLTVAIVSLTGLAVIVYVVVRSQVIAAGLLLLLFTLTDAAKDQLSLSMTVSGFHLYAVDFFCAILIVVAAFRSLTSGMATTLLPLGWALTLLLLFHVARGAIDFGIQPAVNSARPWFYFLAAMLFAATAPKPWGTRVWRLMVGTSFVLLSVSVMYMLVDGIQPASDLIVRNGQLISNRPITSAGALLILEAAILLLATRRLSAKASSVLAAAVLADIVVLQERTVWVAALVVGVLGFVAWSRRRLPENESLVFGATGAVLIATPFLAFGFLAEIRSGLLLTETTSSSGTFAWRTQSWQELLSSHHSLLNITSGGPAGESWARTINGDVVTLAPHDAFVEAFLRFGVPGVVLFVGLLLSLWVRRRDVSAASGLPTRAVGLILIALAVYCVTYSPDLVQGLVLGIFIAALSAEARAPSATLVTVHDDTLGQLVVGHQ